MKRLLAGLAAVAAVALSPLPAAAAGLPTCSLPLSAGSTQPATLSLAASVADEGDRLISSQDMLWRPPGSEITVTIGRSQTLPAPVAGTLVCYGWEYADGVPGTFSPGARSQVRTDTPDKTEIIADMPAWLGDRPMLGWLDRAPHKVRRTGFGTVPVAQVRVIRYDSQGTVLEDLVAPLAVTNPMLAGTIALLAVAGAFGVLALGVRVRGQGVDGMLHRIVASSTGTPSLSQLQVLLWVFVIGAAATYVMALSGELVNISGGTLTLLGIAGASALGTQLKNSRDAAAATVAASTDAAPSADPPRWSDLLLGDDGQIDMTRVQMLFFTLISAAFVMMTVATRMVIPQVPENYLLLMGISNGVYFAAKFTTPAAK